MINVNHMVAGFGGFKISILMSDSMICPAYGARNILINQSVITGGVV